MSAYKELELAETERDEFEAREAIKWESRNDMEEHSNTMDLEDAIDFLKEEIKTWMPVDEWEFRFIKAIEMLLDEVEE